MIRMELKNRNISIFTTFGTTAGLMSAVIGVCVFLNPDIGIGPKYILGSLAILAGLINLGVTYDAPRIVSRSYATNLDISMISRSVRIATHITTFLMIVCLVLSYGFDMLLLSTAVAVVAMFIVPYITAAGEIWYDREKTSD